MPLSRGSLDAGSTRIFADYAQVLLCTLEVSAQGTALPAHGNKQDYARVLTEAPKSTVKVSPVANVILDP